MLVSFTASVIVALGTSGLLNFYHFDHFFFMENDVPIPHEWRRWIFYFVLMYSFSAVLYETVLHKLVRKAIKRAQRGPGYDFSKEFPAGGKMSAYKQRKLGKYSGTAFGRGQHGSAAEKPFHRLRALFERAWREPAQPLDWE